VLRRATTRPARGRPPPPPAATHRAGIDEVVDKIERRAVDFKEKPRLRARGEEEKVILTRIADGQADRSRDRRIVKVKRFDIEPMFEEDALTRMEELGHDFFVFVNAETERVGILYRRDDGHFGLIEPVIGGEYTKGKSRNGANGRR
jgi:putative sigma-54 modulation protein